MVQGCKFGGHLASVLQYLNISRHVMGVGFHYIDESRALTCSSDMDVRLIAILMFTVVLANLTSGKMTWGKKTRFLSR